MRPAEWRWAAAASAVIMALTLAPYAIGFAKAGPEWRFSGFVFGVDDGNSYIGKMALGARGAWLFHLFYTTEPHQGLLAFSFHLLLGKAAVLIAPPLDSAALHERLVAWYHGARLLCGFGLLLVSYRFCAEFLRVRRQRRLAFLLIAAGGGLGWLWTLAGLPGLPLEFYSPEAFTFLTLTTLPHLALARALLLGGMLLFWRGTREGGWRHGLGAGLLWLLLGLVQPLYLVVAYAVLSACSTLVLARASRIPQAAESRIAADIRSAEAGRLWRAALPAIGLSAPLFLYIALAFRADPIAAQWQRQNLILSPAPLHYLAAWGLWLVPALWALVRWARTGPRHRPDFTLLAGWLAVVPILIYLPYNLQRRFAEGAQLPLVCLAVWGLTTGSKPGTRRIAIIAVTALSLMSSPLLLAGGAATALRPAPPAFLPRAAGEAFGWLGENAAPGSAVLTDFAAGNALPAYAPVKVYLGHGPETAFAERKTAEVAAFFDAQGSDDFRRSLLRRAEIHYVLQTPSAGALAADAILYLEPAAAFDGYRIYRVVLHEIEQGDARRDAVSD